MHIESMSKFVILRTNKKSTSFPFASLGGKHRAAPEIYGAVQGVGSFGFHGSIAQFDEKYKKEAEISN